MRGLATWLPTDRWRLPDTGPIGRVRALWAYRGFVLGMVARDFRSRYLGSVLGTSWAILNPLSQILIYTVVFSQVMRIRLPGLQDTLAYSLYLCAGLLTWSYFIEVVTRSQSVFLEQANLLKKVNFPRVTLPIYVFLSASVNFAIVWGLFLAFLLAVGRWPGWTLLALLPLLVVQQALAVGLGVFLGVFNVFFRDVAQAVGVGLQFWFWLTPIVYPLGAVPEGVQAVIAWNPAFPLVTAYQRIIVEHRWPVWSDLWPAVAAAAVLAVLSDLVFRRLSGAMVDEI
ncbi:MAG: ABC transporter permease [Candidatus Rokubacteria bacterium]|nr:ABC transporter permease [Candidatus Rokubacteria bacterium]